MGVACKWTNDSKRLLLEHFDAIYNSPSQIYHFALLFSPSSSWLQKCYSGELSQKIRVVQGLPPEWGLCSRTITLDNAPFSLSYQGNTIAVGCVDPDIIILDAITGSQMAVLSGHTSCVRSVTFSSDGRSLASGSDDTTVKLWDVQTGGIFKTFHGHNNHVYSVSISGDYTRIVSGSRDCTICLWDIWTGEHLHTIKQQSSVYYTQFSPEDPQCIISVSECKVWEWNGNSQQTSSLYDATSIAFSPDYTQLALCIEEVIAVRDLNSAAIVAQSNISNKSISQCCFSSDGRLVAAAASRNAYVWDTTSPECCLIETFVGHSDTIWALAFSSPSSLISVSNDNTIKFWQVGASPKSQTATDPESAPLTSPSIQSVSLQTAAGVAISSDEAGVVKTWDLSTGLCKTSFKTPAGESSWRDVQLIDGRLIIVWYNYHKICVWDTNKDELLHVVNIPDFELKGLRISGDGSKFFCLTETSIKAWSIYTGEHMGEVELELVGKWYLDPLQMDGSRIWVRLESLSTQGWDFGISGSSPAILPIGSAGRPVLDFIGGTDWQTPDPSWIQDTVSRKKVFQLFGKYAKISTIQWDGRYLAAGYESGEVLIVDFQNMHPL